MGKTLKVGVVGVGGIARRHMPGWSASEHAEVIAGSDVVEPALKSWGSTHGIDRLYTKAKDLFADPDIDIVDVCTPNMYHKELTIAGLNAGKHVICEKPLAPTAEDILEMIEARDRSGKLLMTAQHFRFSGISKAMKKEIQTGSLGNVYHGRSWMLRRNAFIPSPSFVEKRHSGGGPSIDVGVHVLDLTLWLMGNPKPVAVSGVAGAPLAHIPGQFPAWRPGQSMPKTWDVEDYAVGFVRFEHGGTLVLETSWLLHHDIEGEDMQIWLYGDQGGCHFPSAQFLSSNYETKQLYNRTLKITRDDLEPHAQECVEFAQAITDGAPSPVPSEHSLQVLAILNGIYKSQEAGKEILLDY